MPEHLARYASLADAAQYLGCSKLTIRRHIATGHLRGYRFGSKMMRVDLREIDSLMRPIPAAGGAA